MVNSVDSVQTYSVYIIISIGRHYLLTIFAVKFEIVYYIIKMYVCYTVVCKAGGVDPDQKLPFVTSHRGLHRLQRFICGTIDLLIRCASISVSILKITPLYFDRPEISFPVVVSKTNG